MTLFEEIASYFSPLNEMIASDSTDSMIKAAINNVLRAQIVYDDKKDKTISRAKGKRVRYILPVAYGLTRNGKRAIRAYQTAGSTKRGVPKWKLFLLENIISWTNSKKSFKQYGQTLIDLGLNLTGDKHLPTLFAITPIANNNIPVKDNSQEIDYSPISKNDVSPEITQNIGYSKTQKEPQVAPGVKPISRKDVNAIDNSQDNNYFNNKVKASNNEPVKTVDITPNINTDTDDNTIYDKNVSNDGVNINAPETEPITKTDINSSNDIDTVKDNFNNMMSRMNNLYKDKEKPE